MCVCLRFGTCWLGDQKNKKWGRHSFPFLLRFRNSFCSLFSLPSPFVLEIEKQVTRALIKNHAGETILIACASSVWPPIQNTERESMRV